MQMNVHCKISEHDDSLNFHRFVIFNAEISLSVFTGEHYCLLRATILHSFTFVPNYVIMMCIFCHVDILCLSASCNRLIWFLSFSSLGTFFTSNYQCDDARYQKDTSSWGQNVGTSFPFRYFWVGFLNKHPVCSLMQVWKFRSQHLSCSYGITCRSCIYMYFDCHFNGHRFVL